MKLKVNLLFLLMIVLVLSACGAKNSSGQKVNAKETVSTTYEGKLIIGQNFYEDKKRYYHFVYAGIVNETVVIHQVKYATGEFSGISYYIPIETENPFILQGTNTEVTIKKVDKIKGTIDIELVEKSKK